MFGCTVHPNAMIVVNDEIIDDLDLELVAVNENDVIEILKPEE